MRVIKYLIVIVFYFYFGLAALMAQNKVGTTSFQFLKINPGARTTAMGLSTISLNNGAEALFSNPAGMSNIGNYDVQLSHTDWFIDTKIYSLAAGFKISDFNIGVFGSYFDYGSIEVTDVSMLKFNDDYTEFNPGLTGQVINPYSEYIGIAFSKSITDKFSFGVAGKYVRENLVAADASVFAIDAGLIYATGFKSIMLGGVVSNFGLNEVKFLDSKQYQEVNQQYDPTAENPGDSIITKTVTGESYPIPQTFAFGISAYLISPGESLISHNELIKLLFAYQLQHPRDYDLQHNFGLEFSWQDIIYFRGGYKVNYDEEGLTFGFGVQYSGFNVGYSYDSFGDLLDTVHRFSIGFSAE
ncbi:MAG: PorV/PorQ family protein [Bacteroidetes bacterium]|nr:PorV/PorQ family protein [Bacteroidota bacterium]